MAWRKCLWGVIPFAAMVIVEVTDVGLTTLSKAAMSKGMSPFVYVVYYNGLGTLLLLPSFFFQRTKRPPLTYFVLWRFFLLGLIGVCFGQCLAFVGIRYSSPTLSSSLGNLIPAFTFLLAIIFRMEKLDMKSSSSQAKVVGAIVSISGAFVVTLYKGPPIIIIPSPPFTSPHDQLLLLSSRSNWVLGGFLLTIVMILAAIWNILQTATVKEYPSETTIIFFYCFFGTIQSAIYSLVAENDSDAWRLKSNIELITIIYSAVFGSVCRTIIHTWSLHKKGPVYVAMFRPLGIVIAVLMSTIFLGDTLHVGSVIGGIIISLGFYAVIWGKSKEDKLEENYEVLSSEESSTQRVPLLQNKEVDPESLEVYEERGKRNFRNV